ncbi:MAG: hypothetical protein AAB641_01260 [Patescibacteria group bacterium]
MNPEEKHLIERSLKLSEENNQILKKMDKKSQKSGCLWIHQACRYHSAACDRILPA